MPLSGTLLCFGLYGVAGAILLMIDQGLNMAGKLWITLGMMAGLACGSAFAQDAPKLRTLDGRQVKTVGSDNTASAQNAGKEIAKADKAVAVQTSDAKPAAGQGNDNAAKSLPVSDIKLPAPAYISKLTRKQLADKVAPLYGLNAIRNSTVGVQVVDLDSGDVIYSHDADKLLKPASNTKLVTTAAALAILGPDHRFKSELLAQGKIDKGVLNGNLQLYIDHDFTWSVRFYETGDVPLRGLIQQLKAAGIQKITGKIIVSGYVVYGGAATGVLEPAAHLVRVRKAFENLLKSNKITYGKLEVAQTAKRSGTPVATWHSPVLSEAIVPLNRSSHNEYADMLAMAIGSHVSGKNTYAAGTKAIASWLSENGLGIKGFSQNDGSGLSHDNRMSASFFTSLVAYMLKSPYGREWAASLSISGYDGTYGGRMLGDESRGRVYAKTGTLRDTISASGFFVNKYDGHTYAFSILVNGMRNRKLTRQAVDRILRVFVGNHMGAKVPDAPVFSSFRKEQDGRVVARWQGVENVAGYRVYRSIDGNTWQVAAETKDSVLIMPDEKAHLRLTAVLPNGVESLPSLIFSYRPGQKKMTIVEAANCRSDEEMRPANHILAHERPLGSLVAAEWGVETVRVQDATPTDAMIYHATACGGQLKITGFKPVPEIPTIVNIVDAHTLTEEHSTCAPESGKLMGCLGEPAISRDRRLGDLSENYRLRKAAGSGSTRPSSVNAWNGAKAVLRMASMPVAMTAPTSAGGSITVAGFDLQALDSQAALDHVWKKLMP